jgi:hypothetical protein
MTDAESGLAEFSGTRGHEGAQRAADLLAQLIAQCQGMGGECQGCLPTFQPKLGDALSQTMGQLLAELGMGSGAGGQGGFGIGAGGGYSSRTSGAQNVGLYGGTPFVDAAGFQDGSSEDSQPAAGMSNAGSRTGRDRGAGYSAPRAGTASAGGDVVVPLQYQQQVGRYLDRLSDELGDE